ncbi:zf-HC2 domain-containing protein [Aggregatilinea lenta]|uniref:zf-HC2 domain-containing protein n=1 Tax=Aggregatilinea lenta TaxID=913108 RepID=UPI000E5AE1D6|nr:zf-HC2 domain-containing protein [Aggregatilinea lenta]
MRRRHVTHLLTRYVHDQLAPAQVAQVINHVRTCASCRAALVREERLAAGMRREMPAFGQATQGQLAHVWAGVWGEVATSGRRGGLSGSTWLPGLSFMVAALLVVMVVLPLISQSGVRAEAAPVQPRPAELDAIGSPTASLTGEAATQNVAAELEQTPATPAATVAYVSNEAGVSPVPVPRMTQSPDAWMVQ